MAKSNGGSASKKNTSKNTSAKKKTNTGAQSAKKTAKPKVEDRNISEEEDNGFYDEAILIVCLILTVLLEMSVFGLGGAFGKIMSDVLFGLFGFMAYILPIAFFLCLTLLTVNWGNKRAIQRVIFTALIFLSFSAFVQILSGTEKETIGMFYTDSAASKSGGGFFGGLLAHLLTMALGKAGAIVVVVGMFFVFLLLATGISYKKAITNTAKKQKARREKRREIEESNIVAPDKRAKKLAKNPPEDDPFHRKERAEGNRNMADALRVLPADTDQGILKDGKKTKTHPVAREEVHEIKMEFADNETKPAKPVSIKAPGEMPVVKAPEQRTGEKASDERPDVSLPEDELKRPKRESVVPSVLPAKEEERKPDKKISAPKKEKSTKAMDADGSSIFDKQDKQGFTKIGQNAGPVTDPVTGKTVEPLKSTNTGLEVDESDYDGDYTLPPISLLNSPKAGSGTNRTDELEETKEKLQETLASFGVDATVTHYSQGPAVTRFEIEPGRGVKVSKIVGLADDIKLQLAAPDVRIEAPIPGKAAVGIEIPNKENTVVNFRELIESQNYQDGKSKLTFAIGKDIGGQVVVGDIAKMPHVLIAGSTGSGKSVCINTLIMSILYKARPNEVKLIMVDPKMVELSVYNGIPHLMTPVVTDPKKAAGALNWAVVEMTKRYELFSQYGVRNLAGYNQKVKEVKAQPDIDPDKVPEEKPQLVVIVDELADLMMVAHGEVEDSIVRLSQLARAAGIHLVIATQRPSVDVITGLIKANVPSRVAFAVSSGVDSRTILDMVGAEKLLGKGDMLYYPTGYPKPVRVQGAFVSDEEVAAVCDFIKSQKKDSDGENDITAQIEAAAAASQASAGSEKTSSAPETPGDGRDEYFVEAGRFIIEKGKASIGMLQRMYRVGFNRAARIMDQLADAGVVGPEEGTKPRAILMTAEEFETFLDGGSPSGEGDPQEEEV